MKLEKKVGFFDIETFRGFTSQIAVIGLKMLDEEYRYFLSAKQFYDYLTRQNYISVLYGFNSGKFDVPVLMQSLEKDGVYFYPHHFSFSGSRLISVMFGKKIMFKDLLGIFANLRDKHGKRGLNVLAKDFIGEEKLDFDSKNIGEITPELIEYNKQDVLILEKIYKKLRELYDNPFPSTAGRMAFEIYQNNFKPNIKSLAYKRGIKAIYRGGRTEIFKFCGNDIRLYDVNSLYPFVMLNFSYPVGRMYNEKNINKEGYSYAVIKAPYNYIPYLSFYYNNKLIFPWGTFAGYYTNFELRQAKKHGYEVEIIDGWVCDETENLFEDYVKKFYQMRIEAKKNNNKTLDTFAKILLNSLYGKFGQNPIRANYTVKLVDNVKEGEMIIMLFGENKKYAVVRSMNFNHSIYYDYVIAGYITAYGRDILYNYIKKANEKNVFYVDTDSLLTFADLENYVGSELGLLKNEGDFEEYKALLPKVYFLRKGDKKIIKAKGFTEVNDISKHLSEKRNVVFGLREAMRRFSNFFMTGEKEKRIQNDYDKRIKVDEIETEPIKVEIL